MYSVKTVIFRITGGSHQFSWIKVLSMSTGHESLCMKCEFLDYYFFGFVAVKKHLSFFTTWRETNVFFCWTHRICFTLSLMCFFHCFGCWEACWLFKDFFISCSCFPWIFEEFHFDNIIWCQFDYYGLLFSFPCVLLRCQWHCFLYSNRDILLVTICINLLESNWKIGSHLLVILWLPDAFLLTPYQLIHSFV